MSKHFGKSINWIRKTVLAIALVALSCTFVNGQTNFFQTVGGIKVDASGVLVMNTQQFNAELRERLQKQLEEIDPAVAKQSGLRMISLKGIEAALRKAIETGEEIPDEIKFMAGIQRLQYVFVYPEKNDVVLAGKGEGWVVDANGNVVGKTTGEPVIRLEDFLVAMRTADNARRDYGISVSINPTAEGVQRLQAFYRRIGTGFNADAASAVEETMGPQDISLTGIPTDSRYAQVLVAADFRMKRMAMGFEQASVAEMPSILEMAQKRRKALSMTPRFWLECNYDSVKKSEDGLAWEISGPGAKALTEEESLLDPQNKRARKPHAIATKWAESMTEKFSELASEEVVFAELRNIMDMSVIAALIQKENLLTQASLELPLIQGQDKSVDIPSWHTPKTVPTQCSFCKIGRDWMVTASGGIQIDSWGVLENTEIDQSISKARELAASNHSENNVFWNGE